MVRSVERTLASRYSTYIDEVTRLIRAAVAVMDRLQTTNPKVSDIVREAGLSNQAFYKHFRSKSELFLAILDDGQRELVTYLQHQTDKADTGLGKIRNWVVGIMSQASVSNDASATRGVMMNSHELQAEYPDECDRLNQLLTEPLVAAIELAEEEGTVRAHRFEEDRHDDLSARGLNGGDPRVAAPGAIGRGHRVSRRFHPERPWRRNREPST